MKILQVINGLPKAAGTSVFCGELCNELVTAGHDVTIAVDDPDSPDCFPLDSRIHLIAISDLLREGHEGLFDLVHIHALWAPSLHRVSRWADRSRIPVVWSPHGMLTAWAMNNKKWKKRLGWWLYQKRDLRQARLLHATAESEVEDIRRMGLKNDVVVAPLGVRFSSQIQSRSSVKQNNPRILLFVSRVQRKKGLLNLLEAWSLLPVDLRKDWKIRIVGPDQEGHTAELKQRCDALQISWVDISSTPFDHSAVKTFEYSNNSYSVEFVGPKFGDELTQEYASADLFVLPTHSENFGVVVVESLAQGVPVICTKGAPWEELETEKCGWWIDVGIPPLVSALRESLQLSSEKRYVMGENGRCLVERIYAWSSVGKAMIHGYEVILSKEYQ